MIEDHPTLVRTKLLPPVAGGGLLPLTGLNQVTDDGPHRPNPIHVARSTDCRLRWDADVNDLLDDPLGNHLVAIEGSHRRRLERWWNWASAPTSAHQGSHR